MSPLAMLLVFVFLFVCAEQVEASELLAENWSNLKTNSNNSRNFKAERIGINLGTAGNFAILAKAGITNVKTSSITGNVGTSPITGAALLLECTEVDGTIYSANAAGPLPCRVTDAPRLTIAVGDMQTAYTDAAGRSNPDELNLGGGIIGGETLYPGLYKWTSNLLIPTDIIISGGPDDVFIFQVAGTLTMSSAVKMILEGGAQARNIFWQTADAVTLGTTSQFEGNLLGQTSIAVQTGAKVNGRLLAQTAVTLQSNTVTVPSEGDQAKIGDLRDGGVVFWVNPSDKTKGLVCALEDASKLSTWWSVDTYTVGATGTAIGTGFNNTTKIINSPKSNKGDAAEQATSYRGGDYDDWFLPSKDELEEMLKKKGVLEVQAGMQELIGLYWSSSERDYSSARLYSGGMSFISHKGNKHLVRAVRAF